MVLVRHRKLEEVEAKDSREFEFPYDIKIHIENLLKDSDCLFLYWADCTHHKERMNIIETAILTDNSDMFRARVDWCINQLSWMHIDAVITINIFEFSSREQAEAFKANQEKFFIENVR